MLKILIAVDGSEPAKRAIEAAGKIAHATVDVEATLVCVRTGAFLEPIFSRDYSEINLKKLDAEQENQQTAVLNDATNRAKELGLKTSEPVRAYGSIAHEILRVAKERQVDMIAMGTRGLGTLGSMLHGSVAQRVLHESTAPVLMVK